MFQSSFLLKPLAVFLFFSVTLLFSGCGGTTDPPTVEPDNFNYSVTVDNTPEIRISGSPFEVSTNNCGSPVSTSETFSKSREFDTSVDFELSEAVIGEVGGGVSKVAEAKLGAQVGASLKIGIGSREKVDASRQITTPPDSKTTIKLQWEEVWAKGNVSVKRTDGTAIGNIPFFALTTMSLSQKEVSTIKCGTVVPTLQYQPLVINGTNYPRPDPNIQPYCVAQVHTDENNVTYNIIVPKGWVMIWDSYKAYWPGGNYEDNGLLAIYGEWRGAIEIDTGASCSVPIEWVDFALQNRRNSFSVPSRSEYFIGEVP